MDYQTITTREDSGIGIVTLARPDMMNALNRQMRAELTHALTDMASRVRVLVLTGEGRAFLLRARLGRRRQRRRYRSGTHAARRIRTDAACDL